MMKTSHIQQNGGVFMIGWLILAAVLALCAGLCIRAARFKPEAGAGAAPTPVAVDTEGAV